MTRAAKPLQEAEVGSSAAGSTTCSGRRAPKWCSRRCKRPTPTPSPSAGSDGAGRVPGLAAHRGSRTSGAGPASLRRALQPAPGAPSTATQGAGSSCRTDVRRRGPRRERSSTRPARRPGQRVLASCMNPFTHPSGFKEGDSSARASSIRWLRVNRQGQGQGQGHGVAFTTRILTDAQRYQTSEIRPAGPSVTVPITGPGASPALSGQQRSRPPDVCASASRATVMSSKSPWWSECSTHSTLRRVPPGTIPSSANRRTPGNNGIRSTNSVAAQLEASSIFRR